MFKENPQTMNQYTPDQHNAALGSSLGACVGDAAGATLEFLGKPITPELVDRALSMPGGGVWNVAPGQVTDDCELGISLARALANSPSFDLDTIANAYAAWIKSKPFDIGNTTIQSLGSVTNRDWQATLKRYGPSYTMTTAAAQLCMESKSNGSLMRATPIGIWAHRQSPTQIAEIARLDSCLSHPNECCWQSVACYSIAIAHLINHTDDRIGAYEAAQGWATIHANAEVQSWLIDAKNNVDVPYTPMIGFVRIGFTHAFRHLLLGTPYVDALHETLLGDGDTDTNACIVGGLLGAAYGVDAIPMEMRESVLTCDTSQGQKRPDFLHPRQVPELVKRMLQNARHSTQSGTEQ